jgi:hypothetical protein
MVSAIAGSSFCLSPVIRGEGHGEGPLARARSPTHEIAPHPWPSPHEYMGRGEQRGNMRLPWAGRVCDIRRKDFSPSPGTPGEGRGGLMNMSDFVSSRFCCADKNAAFLTQFSMTQQKRDERIRLKTAHIHQPRAGVGVEPRPACEAPTLALRRPTGSAPAGWPARHSH